MAISAAQAYLAKGETKAARRRGAVARRTASDVPPRSQAAFDREFDEFLRRFDRRADQIEATLKRLRTAVK